MSTAQETCSRRELCLAQCKVLALHGGQPELPGRAIQLASACRLCCSTHALASGQAGNQLSCLAVSTLPAYLMLHAGHAQASNSLIKTGD